MVWHGVAWHGRVGGGGGYGVRCGTSPRLLACLHNDRLADVDDHLHCDSSDICDNNDHN